jgi:branched-chain amino acid transport system permease protein
MNRRMILKPVGYGALVVALFLAPLCVVHPYVLHVLIVVLLNIVLACSLRFTATSGQLSLGHGGMASIGAYTSALLVMKLGFSSWAALPLAGVAAMILAVLVGYPFVRLKGIYFAMVTLFLAQFIQLAAEQWKGLTGGTMGIQGIPWPDPIVISGVINIDFASRAHFYYLALVLAVAAVIILYAIESSRMGVTFQSLRQSSPLAESIGINTSRFRVLAFSIGCFFAGIVGAFYCQYFSTIVPAGFGFLMSVNVIVYMVVGGMRRFYGPIIGATLLTVASEMAGEMKEFEPFVFAGILLLIILFLPEGLISLPRRLKNIAKKGFSHA